MFNLTFFFLFVSNLLQEKVAELTMTRCIWEAGVLVRIILWILATRVGTLALCGRRCVSGEFPYVRRFADMPVERREAALKRWNATRWLVPLKIIFALIKVLCHFVFYTAVMLILTKMVFFITRKTYKT